MGTSIKINLNLIKSNISNLKKLLKLQTMLMAVVKSNAYGHGIVECAKTAVEAGADWLGVVTLDEATRLRQNNILKPILILGAVSLLDARKAAIQEVSIPIFSLSQAHEVAETYFDKKLNVHLKIDTGLNRLGLEIGEIQEAVKTLKTNSNIKIEGIYSHLASVEESDMDYTRLQLKNFQEAIKVVQSAGCHDLIKHIAASSATLLLPESHLDMVRCGVSIYGLWPSEENKKSFNNSELLKPALSMTTELMQVKKVDVGEKIGYGCTYTAKKPMTIGVLPIGYYDGFDRALSNKGEVLVDGVRCPVIGRVAMNMTVIDLSITSQLKGQSLLSQKDCPLPEVVIIGEQGGEEITADEIAQKLKTINYEVVARLPESLERKYS